ncbi:MAG TPA: hypothetical protein ENH60_07210 [Pricia sp.]|nr:hypothetical protein [Pricia sp.]
MRLQVEHGVSIASSMITTDIITAEVQDKTPADGYEAIAKALLQGVYFQAKASGMMSESDEEHQKDMSQRFAESEVNDLD